jgi:hypothetical protein
MASTGHSDSETIQNPGTFETSSGLKTLFLVFIVIGAIAFAAGLSMDTQRTWASFMISHFYFMSLAIGGLFIAAIQWLTGAMWSAPVRRFSESFTAYLPIALISVVVLYFGMHHLYVWTDMTHVRGDKVLEGKSGYLSVGFFMVRNLVAVLIWILFAKKMIGNSLAQDVSKDASLTLKNRSLSPLFIILFGLTFTIASFDQLMSLDPHWFSTMFGVYCFAGMFYSSLALTCLVTLYMRKHGKLDGIVNENHLHDLGKFMFAFTVFWAYIGFSQFMLIWYANLPEETSYYILRFQGGWFYVSVFLLVGKFMTPFFILLPRDSKRSDKVLWIVGIWMMFAQWIDVMWMVQPQFFADGPRFGWIEIGMGLGFLGLFATVVTRFLAKNNIVAIGDPRLAESVFHHHQ